MPPPGVEGAFSSRISTKISRKLLSLRRWDRPQRGEQVTYLSIIGYSVLPPPKVQLFWRIQLFLSKRSWKLLNQGKLRLYFKANLTLKEVHYLNEGSIKNHSRVILVTPHNPSVWYFQFFWPKISQELWKSDSNFKQFMIFLN